MSTRWALAGILILAAGTRLYRIDGPLLDQLFVKQVFVANKARAIAGPPFDPMRDDFDFLDDSGHRMRLTEEIPLYTGLLGAGYHLYGEHEWLGRAMNILATLVALVAFFDLARREFDRRLALVSTLLLAVCPLLVFYGRAVLPDPAMLAGMLVAACCYRRYLDGGGYRWLVGAAVAGLAAAALKYYGLMVLLPLADMAYRRHGWRGWFRWDFLLPAAVMVLPVAAWMGGVFQNTPNPTRGGVYFLFQQPELITQPTLYKRFVERFLYKDCGPVLTVLLLVGVWAAWARGVSVRPLLSWTVMGVGFYFLFGPKLDRHDYYGLMMLPAAALWAGVGWFALWGEGGLFSGWRCRAGAIVLLAAVVIHSPLVMAGKYRLEAGQLLLAERLRELTPPGERVLFFGPEWTHAVVHYSGREGWVVCEERLDPRWPERLAHYRELGARHVVVYFSTVCGPAVRESFRPLVRSLPVVEHHTGTFGQKITTEFYVLSLADPPGSPVRP